MDLHLDSQKMLIQPFIEPNFRGSCGLDQWPKRAADNHLCGSQVFLLMDDAAATGE